MGTLQLLAGPTLLQRLQLSARHVSSQRAVAALRSSMLRGAPAALQFAGSWPHGAAAGPNNSNGGRSAFGSGQLHSHASGGFGAMGSGGDVFGSGGGLGPAGSGPGARLGGFGSGAVGEGASMASGLGPVQWAPGPAALGLPAVCYWVSVASLVEELAVLRCPSDLLQRLQGAKRRWMDPYCWFACRGDVQLEVLYDFRQSVTRKCHVIAIGQTISVYLMQGCCVPFGHACRGLHAAVGAGNVAGRRRRAAAGTEGTSCSGTSAAAAGDACCNLLKGHCQECNLCKLEAPPTRNACQRPDCHPLLPRRASSRR